MKKTYRDLRAEMNYTQKQVADELGIDCSYYSMIENYKRKFRLDLLTSFFNLYSEVTGKRIEPFEEVKLI
jgi:transcriptional regulator with XRE-family HTH domain